MTKAFKKGQAQAVATAPNGGGPAAAGWNERHAGLAAAAANGAGAATGRRAALPDAGPRKQGKAAKAPKKHKRLAVAPPLSGLAPPGHEDRLARLARTVHAVRTGERAGPRTAKLLAGGLPKMAQKLVEEAAETAIDAVRQQRTGLINESADLLYNLVVLWSAMDVTPDDVWSEMDRREALLGMAEKLPKADEAVR